MLYSKHSYSQQSVPLCSPPESVVMKYKWLQHNCFVVKETKSKEYLCTSNAIFALFVSSSMQHHWLYFSFTVLQFSPSEKKTGNKKTSDVKPNRQPLPPSEPIKCRIEVFLLPTSQQGTAVLPWLLCRRTDFQHCTAVLCMCCNVFIISTVRQDGNTYV